MFGINTKIFERIKTSLFWGLVMLFLSVGASLLLLQIEQNAAGSQIRNIAELYWWWLMTITGIGAGYDPITPEGRLVATFIVAIAYVLLGLVIAELSIIVRMIYTRKEEGNIQVRYKNHIVIFGYTSLTAGVIRVLRNSFGNKIKIVLISNDTEFNPFPQLVDFISDNPINHQTLIDANVQNAMAAIILANDRFRDPDTYSLAIASSIEAENNKVLTIAETVNADNKVLFKMAKIDAFMDRKDLLKDLLENNPHPKLVRVISKETELSNSGIASDMANVPL